MQIILQQALGYGTYVFQISGSALVNMDPRAVLGIFTYDDTSPDAEKVHYRELDFEVGTWEDVCDVGG